MSSTTSASASATDLRNKSWTKGPYLISTDYALIPAQALNKAFASERLYWAKPVPDEAMQTMLEHSLSFGLYHLTPTPTPTEDSGGDDNNRARESSIGNGGSEREFIGLARCLTDFVTFVYITDVYIDSSHSGVGLGRWLMSCVREVTDAMPFLRRTLLFTGDWERSVPFYEETLGMEVMKSRQGVGGEASEGIAVMERKGEGHPLYVGKVV